MKHILLFIALFCCIQLQAQTAYFKVNNTGSLDKITRLSGGGYITSGFDSNYKHQYIRWDDSFTPLWKVKITDPLVNPFSNFIIEANDGSFYATASTDANSGSLYVMKISSTGTILWQKTYSAPTAGERLFAPCISKAAGTDNGFLFGTGDCTLSNCIVKCDANGAIEWQKQYYYPLASGVITCWSIIPDGTGYVVSSGYNAKSLLTFKIDALGAIGTYSANTYTWTPQIIPTKLVKLNASNGYALLGQYNNSNNNKTQFVAFYNNGLALQSFNELTVTYTQFTLSDIAPINNGQDVVVNGNMYDASKFYSAILKLSSTGTIGWKHLGEGNTSTTNKNVQFNGITALGNSTVNVGTGSNEGAVVGIIDSSGGGLCNSLPFNVTNVPKTLTLESASLTSFNSNVVSATVNYTNTNVVSYNKTIYCGSIPNATQDFEELIAGFQVYPNPGDASIVCESQDQKQVTLSIRSLDGRTVFQQSFSDRIQISTTSWANGLYSVTLNNGKAQVSRKLLIAH
ncbi:MAG: T9SS type A sorting domain-containing protein [Chitinophagaceae bacterium]|nr:T9SS type A sorting domain-containing protein [Chitinophagaceae bacterium]